MTALSEGDKLLAERIFKLLRDGPYELARRAFLTFELLEERRAASAIIDLRDVLDHIYLACKRENPEDQNNELYAAEEHLRRASIEPSQTVAENRLARLLKGLRFYQLHRVFYSGLPKIRDVHLEISEIKRDIQAGREAKGRRELLQDCFDHFKQAHARTVDLEHRMQPSRLRGLVRLSIIVVTILASGIVGAIIQRIASGT